MRRRSLHLLRLTLLTALAGCPPGEKEPALCPDGESILLADGTSSGFERCPDGAVNRVSAASFDPTIDLDACRGDEDSKTCETDTECTDRPNGKCVSDVTFDYYTYGEVSICGCAYACETDADCDEGTACAPPEVTGLGWATCIAASCATSDDCETGECGYSAHDDGCGVVHGLDCRTDEDACHADADCLPAEETCWPGYGGEEPWQCGGVDCAIGRPLLVEGTARVAGAVARSDWAEGLEVAVPLDPADRAALAAYWVRVAALEHASVGSFARATLQLLAIGAPPALLAETQAAAADEVRHARLAYGLAGAYGGAPVGPGPLALADAAPALDLRATMHALVAEACVGETLGAAELAAAADTCVDPRLAAALRAVADDETRHAALAWRTLAWILETAPELRDEAHAALLARVEEALATRPDASPHLPEHGVHGPDMRAAVHRAVVADVIHPCIAACIARAAA
ncbi:MAG: ferritin-like domain-containing protein [Myxococcota bacterium]